MIATTSHLFQSTPPARGATETVVHREELIKISIHAPREGGDGVKLERLQTRSISIHAPREGGDGFVF